MNASDTGTDIPGSHILGHGINLTVATGQDFAAIFSSIITDSQTAQFSDDALVKVASAVLKVDEDSHGISLPDKRTYTVPINVTLSTEGRKTTASFYACNNGAAVQKAFTNTGFRQRYSLFGGDASCIEAAAKMFQDDHKYALFDMINVCFTANLQYDPGSINEVSSAKIKNLPVEFAPQSAERFVEFFKEFGTHVIKSVTYGSRLHLICWISDSDVERHGASSDDGLESITSGQDLMNLLYQQENSNRRFTTNLHKYRFTSGDYEGIKGASVNTRPRARNHRAASSWLDPSCTNLGLVGIELEDIWRIASASLDPEVSCRASALHNAFQYITAHPVAFKTAARLSISSDWAEFSIDVPGATVAVIHSSGDKTDTIKCKSGRIQWGRPGSYKFGEVTIDVEISHDRFPVYFSTGHGSLAIISGKRTIGKINICIDGTVFGNDKIVDDMWNIRPFVYAPRASHQEAAEQVHE